MNRSVEKIQCPNCEVDNFASSPVCWKCGKHLSTRPLPLPFLLTPSSRRKAARKKVRVRPVNLSIFLAFYVIPVMLVLIEGLSLLREGPVGFFVGAVFAALSGATVHSGYQLWRGMAGSRKDFTILLTINCLYSFFKLVMAYAGTTFAQSLAFASAVPWRECTVVITSALFLAYLNAKEMREYCPD